MFNKRREGNRLVISTSLPKMKRPLVAVTGTLGTVQFVDPTPAPPAKGQPWLQAPRFVAVDVETGGPSPGRVTEIGAVVVETLGRIGSHFSAVFDGEESASAIWHRFLTFAGDSPLVAYGGTDLHHIRREVARVAILTQVVVFNALPAVRAALPNLRGGYTLGNVVASLHGGIPEGLQPHQALDDALMLASVLVAIRGGGHV